jgi:hypothetical protein
MLLGHLLLQIGNCKIILNNFLLLLYCVCHVPFVILCVLCTFCYIVCAMYLLLYCVCHVPFVILCVPCTLCYIVCAMYLLKFGM